MGLVSKLKGLDLDDVLSYQTLKLVVIKDRRLGGIHYLLELGIFLYIIVYTIVIQQRYLLVEPPYGSIRATARQPPSWGNPQALPYCKQNQSAINNYTNSECVYMLGTDLVYPPGLIDSIFVATRIKDTYITLPSSNCSSLPTTLECAPNTTGAPSVRYYTADVEDYTVYLEHSIFGRENSIMMTNLQCKGDFRFKDKHTKALNFTDPGRGGDILPIRTFLQAAGITSLDEPSFTSGNSSLRYDGTLIILIVNYQNDAQQTNKFSYYYESFHIPGVDVLSMAPSVLQSDGVTLIQRNYYGVRLVFIVVGEIGYFDFPTLLQALMAGAVLIKTASVIVDLLILYVLPDKDKYKEHKFEMTEDFGDLREKQAIRAG